MTQLHSIKKNLLLMCCQLDVTNPFELYSETISSLKGGLFNQQQKTRHISTAGSEQKVAPAMLHQFVKTFSLFSAQPFCSRLKSVARGGGRCENKGKSCSIDHEPVFVRHVEKCFNTCKFQCEPVCCNTMAID